MPTVQHDIEVEAPLRAVYNQWTQFEEFPRFMEGVQEVRQLDPRRLAWKVEVGGRIAEWEAEIEDQQPDELISWRTISGRGVDGRVAFRPAGDDRTSIHLDMSYETEGWEEHVGDALGIIERRVEGDLKRFKEFIEERGRETGGWRGEIETTPIRDGHPVAASNGSTIETNRDLQRERAEERQADPSEPGGAPGGNVAIDPMTGRPRPS